MTELHLPVVQKTDSLRSALTRMREMNVSGAVCEDEKHHWLIYVREVIFALHTKPQGTIGAIGKRISLDDSEDGRLAARIRIQIQRPIVEEGFSYEAMRSPESAGNYAEVYAFVVQIHSASMQKALMSSPLDCFCDKSLERVAGHKDGDKCPNADGGTVRCA
jgi:hypothetical protein